MAYKQPRVPEYSEREGTVRYLKSLTAFLKDFCMAAWKADTQREKEIGSVSYPVTSVNGKTGDVALDAQDVGALAKDGTAADSSKLGGVDASDYYNRDNLVFDDAPVEGSTNPITSGAVHSAMASVSTEYKKVEKSGITHTLGTGVTAYNLELRRRDNVGLLSAYFKFESKISNGGVVATITPPDGYEVASIQTGSLGKGASNSTFSAISASVSDGVISLGANGSIEIDNYVRHNWFVLYK